VVHAELNFPAGSHERVSAFAGRPPVHGRYSTVVVAERRAFRDALRVLRELIDRGD
jgi:hypothetical protein